MKSRFFKKVLLTLGIIFTLFSLFSIPASAQSLLEDIFSKTDNVSKESFDITKKGDEALSSAVQNITQILLGVIGTIGVILIIYAGYLWTTAGGSEDKVKTAKKIIIQVILGIIISSLAYVIVSFVTTQVVTSGKLPAADGEEKSSASGETK